MLTHICNRHAAYYTMYRVYEMDFYICEFVKDIVVYSVKPKFYLFLFLFGIFLDFLLNPNSFILFI